MKMKTEERIQELKNQTIGSIVERKIMMQDEILRSISAFQTETGIRIKSLDYTNDQDRYSVLAKVEL